MKTWKEFTEERSPSIPPQYEVVDVACPQCGAPLYRDTMFVLASYPPKYKYVCLKCK